VRIVAADSIVIPIIRWDSVGQIIMLAINGIDMLFGHCPNNFFTIFSIIFWDTNRLTHERIVAADFFVIPIICWDSVGQIIMLAINGIDMLFGCCPNNFFTIFSIIFWDTNRLIHERIVAADFFVILIIRWDSVGQIIMLAINGINMLFGCCPNNFFTIFSIIFWDTNRLIHVRIVAADFFVILIIRWDSVGRIIILAINGIGMQFGRCPNNFFTIFFERHSIMPDTGKLMTQLGQ
jgi:hypothetical protein